MTAMRIPFLLVLGISAQSIAQPLGAIAQTRHVQGQEICFVVGVNDKPVDACTVDAFSRAYYLALPGWREWFAAQIAPPASLMPSLSPTKIRPGGQVTLTLTLTGTGIVGLNWQTVLPAGWVVPTPSLSPAVAAIPKAVYCNVALCLAAGYIVGSPESLNSLSMPAGALAVMTLTIPATAPAGDVQIGLQAVTATDDAANEIALISTPATLTVLGRFDLNSDGVLDDADALLVRRQIVGQDPCGSADFNGNGRCTAADMQLFIRAKQSR